MKSLYFLAGLPRSGNTVLAALLNQHPDVYVSPLSPLSTYAWSLESVYNSNQDSLRNLFPRRIENVIKQLPHSYYQDVKNPVVIDREKCWTTPHNLKIAKLMSPDLKVVFTTRDILEILSSYVLQARKHNFIDIAMEQDGFHPLEYLPIDDARCDFLMESKYMITKALLGLHTALREENKSFVHLVDYDDLVSRPEVTMNTVTEFLGLPHYQYDFNKIEKLEVELEERLDNQPKDLHTIRGTLGRVSPKATDVLSEYVVSKYGNINFWKEARV